MFVCELNGSGFESCCCHLYGDKIYTNFHDLDFSEDCVECESLTVISIDYSLVYKNKYYHQVYLGSCADKIVDKQMITCLDDNLI